MAVRSGCNQALLRNQRVGSGEDENRVVRTTTAGDDGPGAVGGSEEDDVRSQNTKRKTECLADRVVQELVVIGMLMYPKRVIM